MTLTIDLSLKEEGQLIAAAEWMRMEPIILAKQLLMERLPPEADTRERIRLAAIRAAVGSMAHVGVTVDDLHRERQADKEREER